MATGTPHSTTTLPALPAELLLNIFEATDSFPTALALSKTCHRLHSIWTSNADTILPSIVECFPQAQKLATTQENVAQEQTHPQHTSLVRPEFPITTNQRISQNASLASHMLHTFETHLNSQTTSPTRRTPLTPTERTSFLNGFYNAMTFLTLGNRRSFFLPLPMLTYMQMHDAFHVLDLHLLTSPNSPLHSMRSPESNMTISEAIADFNLCHDELYAEWFVNWPDKEDRWDKVPHGYFTLDDGYRAKVGGQWGEGPLLGDVLKKIAKMRLMMGGTVP